MYPRSALLDLSHQREYPSVSALDFRNFGGPGLNDDHRRKTNAFAVRIRFGDAQELRAAAFGLPMDRADPILWMK
jgi:hypothetical protein